MNNNASYNVFVYGTLKQGRSNHSLLDDAVFLGRNAVHGPYKLMDLGPYPAVVDYHKDNGAPIKYVVGEVYSVDLDTFLSLDALEGYPHFYSRREVDTSFGKAWMYTFMSRADLPEDKWKECDGIWRPTKEEQDWFSTMARVGSP